MIYLATDHGLVVCERDDNWHILRQSLESRRVTSVIAREGVILAGTTDGVFRSDDEGVNWVEASQDLSHRHIRWLAYHPDISDLEFVGSEPAAIFFSRNGGNSWQECGEVAGLRDQHRWFLPYSPEAGCVRGFAFHGERGYAAVEVGGVLRSDDNGRNWQLAEGSDGNPNLAGPPAPFIYPDVHSIYVHPSSPDLVDAPTGGGFYRSVDGGKTWELLYDCYCRSVWTDPSDPAHLILGPADHVNSGGRIEESRDGGRTWNMASAGLNVPWRRHMVERFTQIGSELFAVLSNGEVLSTQFPAVEWSQIFQDVKSVNAITAMPLDNR
jgi:photosystem II stability/assembly factor-like uncharacterized protein